MMNIHGDKGKFGIWLRSSANQSKWFGTQRLGPISVLWLGFVVIAVNWSYQ